MCFGKNVGVFCGGRLHLRVHDAFGYCARPPARCHQDGTPAKLCRTSRFVTLSVTAAVTIPGRSSVILVAEWLSKALANVDLRIAQRIWGTGVSLAQLEAAPRAAVGLPGLMKEVMLAGGLLESC